MLFGGYPNEKLVTKLRAIENLENARCVSSKTRDNPSLLSLPCWQSKVASTALQNQQAPHPSNCTGKRVHLKEKKKRSRGESRARIKAAARARKQGRPSESSAPACRRLCISRRGNFLGLRAIFSAALIATESRLRRENWILGSVVFAGVSCIYCSI